MAEYRPWLDHRPRCLSDECSGFELDQTRSCSTTEYTKTREEEGVHENVVVGRYWDIYVSVSLSRSVV